MSQKLENLFNLALDASPWEREQSPDLRVGYEASDDSWELIVKYHGDLGGRLSELAGGDRIVLEELISGYAIITLPVELIQTVAAWEETEYIEMPKSLYFSIEQGKEASCIPEVAIRPPYLHGAGVLIAVIDSGIDLFREEFRNPDGGTRILRLWDQSMSPDPARGFFPPEGFAVGVELDQEGINRILAGEAAENGGEIPGRDISGHGTAVAEIAAGNGGASGSRYAGVAPESGLIIVKLGKPGADSFPRTTQLMRAMTYVIRNALELKQPVAVNLSFGNTYGSHDGTSLLERFLDQVSEIGRSVICVGSGNEGASGGHAAGKAGQRVLTELSVASYEKNLNVQLWKAYGDEFRLTLTAPGGEQQIIDTGRPGTLRLTMGQTQLLIYVGEPSPYSMNQEIYFDFIPLEDDVDAGIWTFQLDPVRIISGRYYFYLPGSTVRNSGTRFFQSEPGVTYTIPSTAARVITVGAYDSVYDAYADFSGRGMVLSGTSEDLVYQALVKPDLAAPGVNIRISDGRGGIQSVTGTSFATPFVTGAAALLMEWGIVRGKDPYLYGEKVRAYLRRGARPLRGETEYPNNRVGWGALCLANSLPE